MEHTGIIRRVDDLGRVVIPKEVRRMMGFCENQPLEIFPDPDNGYVILRGYDSIRPISDLVSDLRQRISEEENLENKAVLVEKLNELSFILKKGWSAP